jgi:restriction system protein
VYLQAKGGRGPWADLKFKDLLAHYTAKEQGVFITTGNLSDDARKYANTIDPKVVLIDGRQLAELMIDQGLGTTTTATYQIRRIGSDYSTEE